MSKEFLTKSIAGRIFLSVVALCVLLLVVVAITATSTPVRKDTCRNKDYHEYIYGVYE